MSKLLLPFALLMAVAVACGGGGPADLTDREMTDEELALMVLPQSDLGLDYADFELDEEESGFASNEKAIDGAFDEEDEAKDVERFGRVNGYGGEYSAFDAVLEGQGVFLIATDVDLFEDADGASGDFRDTIEDAKRQVGQSSEGATLESAEEFDAGEIADEAAGYAFRATTSADEDGVTLYGTSVGVRRGRIIGSSVIIRLDDQDVREETTALARKLDERIQAVLRGEVEAKPTAKPAARPAPTSEPTPEPSAGVSPSDLLDSFRYSGQIEVEVEGGLVLTAEGEFEAPDRLRCTISGTLGGAAIGKDELVVIGEDAWLDGGDGFEATSADDPDVVDDLDVCPGSPVFWEDFGVLSDLGSFEGEPDPVNGVAATRYRIGQAAEALEAIGFLPSELEGVTVNTFDVWVAEDGGWPVVVDMDVSLDAKAAEEAFGMPVTDVSQQARITIRVDITDVNDAGIHVGPPGP